MSESEGELDSAAAIVQVLRQEGLREELLRDEFIRALLVERRRHHGLEPEAYQRVIERDAAERAWWHSQFAVPETWLFRYPASFEYLREWAGRRVRSGGPSARVLSVACASGAEPFSIVSTLRCAARECGVTDGGASARVTAIDPNAAAIERARSGRMPAMAVRSALPAWAEADFAMAGPGPVANGALLAQIDWSCEAAPEALRRFATGSFDAVFCRNLAIYLDESRRMAIGRELIRVLSPDGLLFLGHAERPAHFGLDEAVGAAPGSVSAALVFARLDASTMTERVRHPAPSMRGAPAATIKAPNAPSAPPKESVHNAQASPLTKPTVAAAMAAADEGRAQEALALAEALHREGNREPALLRLLGVLALGAGADAAAETWLRKSEYAHSGNTETLFQLALLADRRGDAEAARRLRERAARGKVGENAVP